jgi:hypothetical protein
MAHAGEMATLPSLLEAVMLGLDPAVRLEERTDAVRPAPLPVSAPGRTVPPRPPGRRAVRSMPCAATGRNA